MVRLAEESILKEEAKVLEELVLAASRNDELSDDESDDESCALNISCHGRQFQQMTQQNKCDIQIVRKRKLQTHLDSIDQELTELCFTSLSSELKQSKNNDEDISPRTAKTIKRSLEHFSPYTTPRRPTMENTITIGTNLKL